ncbi:MAG: helix-turn-helix domain-containing protein [Pirellulaceae bacterium]|nr:helix-turn-helix domain-containing protein [Pirellulaceae bacterium]
MVSPKTLSLDRPTPRRTGTSTVPSSEMPGAILDVFVYGSENESLCDLFTTDRIRDLGSLAPIYLYGPNSVGKSVIASSLAARYGRLHQATNIVISNGVDFARALSTSIDADDMDRFRTRFRECPLLLIDGLHELVTKPAVQDELIQTLDRRESQCRPTILTGLVLPTTMRGLKPALASRCVGGLSLSLSYPGPEARKRILTLLAKSLDIRIGTDELNHLANRLADPFSVPELQGLLLKWLHQERVARTLATSASSSTLDHLLDARRLSRIPEIAEIAKRVAKETDLKLSDLRGTTRKSHIVRARSLAMFLARQLTSLSYQQIGEYFGRRDHSTVLYSCRKTETDMTNDLDLSRTAEEIKRQLQQI